MGVSAAATVFPLKVDFVLNRSQYDIGFVIIGYPMP